MTQMQELLEWCAGQVEPAGGRVLALVPVAGDASFRRYYRLQGSQPSRVAVYAPPDKELNLEFTRIAALLRSVGVNAPQVLAHEEQRGFLLISDFGDDLLLPALNPESASSLYTQAMDTLLRIQSAECEIDGWVLPYYSDARLRQEMELFPHWFLAQLLQIELDATEKTMIDALFGRLINSALEQPQVLVHRDYHSRNLMLLASGDLGVIDFQDAVRGPISYDLVSLLRDCYIAWPAQQVHQWAGSYAARAIRAGLMPAVDSAVFLRWFDWMGLQRHIKVLGIFARLWLRDGKPAYLRDLPLVMRYVLEVSAGYPELADFHCWFRARVLPLAARQDWYQRI